jgi:hypothetical protein
MLHRAHRPGDGGSKHLWNVGKVLPDYTVPTSRKTDIFTLAAERTWNLTRMRVGCGVNNDENSGPFAEQLVNWFVHLSDVQANVNRTLSLPYIHSHKLGMKTILLRQANYFDTLMDPLECFIVNIKFTKIIPWYWVALNPLKHSGNYKYHLL